MLRHAEGLDAANELVHASNRFPTAGQLIKQARLRAGLSLEELSARVKVNVLRLQALEDDQIEAWPNVNVLRAAASSVCRHVKLDPVVILDQLPKAEKIRLPLSEPVGQAGFHGRGVFTLRRSEGSGASLSLMALALAFLLIAALLFWETPLMDWANHVLERGAPTMVPSAAGPVTEPVLPPDAGPTDTRIGPSAPEPAASTPLASLPAATSPSATASATGAASQEPMVVIKAKGLTWIAVSDAKGVTLLQKTLAAGQIASASGALPLWVVVGRADNAEVLVRGEVMKLEPSVPDNVARFKVQ